MKVCDLMICDESHPPAAPAALARYSRRQQRAGDLGHSADDDFGSLRLAAACFGFASSLGADRPRPYFTLPHATLRKTLMLGERTRDSSKHG